MTRLGDEFNLRFKHTMRAMGTNVCPELSFSPAIRLVKNWKSDLSAVRQ
ncbi:MAG: hypothetical protein KME35_07035 [Aphanocapsa sp. GSE-SYN-MK-11-07L]|nr:hypothetical protein [Aphanocapsa sp. GSE-SYN-MK-11-07L]